MPETVLTCHHVRRMLTRYVDGEVSNHDARALEEHVSTCASCASELEAERQVMGGLNDVLQSATPPRGFDENVMRAVRQVDRTTAIGRLVRWWRGMGVTSLIPPRLVVEVCASLAAAAFLVYAFASTLGTMIGPGHDTLVLGQSRLPEGQTAAVRVVTYTNPDAPAIRPNVPVTLRLRDSMGEWHPLYSGTSNRAGTVDASFRLPPSVEGNCTLEVRTGAWLSPQVVTRPMKIEPATHIAVDTDKFVYRPQDTIHVRAIVSRGNTQALGQPVEFRLMDSRGSTVEAILSTTSTQGIATANFAALNDAGGTYTVTAEAGGSTAQQAISVISPKTASYQIDVDVIPEAGQPVAGLVNTYHIVTSYIDGSPAMVHGTLDQGGESAYFATDSNGIGSASVFVHDPTYIITVRCTDAYGRAGSTSKTFPTTETHYFNKPEKLAYISADKDDGAILRTDKSVYQPSEVVHTQLLARDVAKFAYVDLLVDGHVVLSRSGKIDNGVGKVDIPLPNGIAGTITLNGYYLNGSLAPVRAVRRIMVQPAGSLAIAATTDKSVYRPGDEARVELHVSQTDGRGVAAAVGLKIEDRELGSPTITSARLAALPGPKNFSVVAASELVTHMPDLDRGDTDYNLYANTAFTPEGERVTGPSKGATSILLAVEVLGIFAVGLMLLHILVGSGWMADTGAMVWGRAVFRIDTVVTRIYSRIVAARRHVRLSLLNVAAAVAGVGLIAAIVFPIFAGAREKARNISTASCLKQLRLGQTQWEQDNNIGPAHTIPIMPSTASPAEDDPYWMPDIDTDSGGYAVVTVPIPTSPGSFVVNMTASTADGRVATASIPLPIKR